MKDILFRKLFIWLGFSRQLAHAQECGIINNWQLHELDAIFKRWKSVKEARSTANMILKQREVK